jgi:flagellar basal-body rod modification protein FlgD
MADSLSTSISSLTKTLEPYSASASINENGVIDSSTSKVTGDRTKGLFDPSKRNLGKNDFLQLLVKQLQFQDPLNPMDNTQFISQLAQFTSLENSNNMESAINNLNDSFQNTVKAQQYSAQSMNNTAAVSLIGKEVRLRQTTVSWVAKAGASETLNVSLGNAKSAVVQILDKDGAVVKTLETSGKDSENSATATWDGTTDLGEPALTGTYTVKIVGEETHPELYAFVQDVVDGVRFGSDGALAKIGGKEISIANVLDVSGSGTVTGTGAQGTGLTPTTAVALLGKQVRIRETTVSYKQLEHETVSVNVAAGARKNVSIQLVDSTGNVAYSTTTLVGADGIARFVWNGQKADGSMADAGTYRIRITGEERDASLYAFSEGVVSGIANINGDARLRVGSSTISLSSIIDIADVSGEEG